MCACIGDVAINILREMLSNGIPPNQLCYGAALVACVKSYMWDEVDELLKEMADIGLPLLESVLGSVINACRLQQPYVNAKSPQILSWGVDYPNIETNAESLHKLIELQLVKANVEREQQHRGSAQWQKALSLMTTWAKSVENCTDSLYTMTMDVLESYHEYDKMIHVYQMMINASIPISKSSLSFAMRAALNVMDSSFAIKLLEDARREGLDNGYLYNTTMVLCDKCGRHEEATRALLMALTSSHGLSPPPLSSTISSLGSMGRPRLPSVWITRKVISNALDALTRNFSALFTEVVDGKLSPSEKIKPFVRDLTIVLRCTVYEKNLYLSPTSYPMANKLLLDAGDFDTLRGKIRDSIVCDYFNTFFLFFIFAVLLNHTLYMSEVNSTRLYDFAAKSLTRIKSIEQGLQVILLLIADLCATGYHRTAVAIFLQGVHRIGSQIVLLLSESSVIQNKGGAMLIKTGSLQHSPSTRSLQTGGKNVGVPISSPTTNCRKAFIQRKELSVKLYNYSQILQKYFRDAKFLIGKGNFPSRAYKTTAHIYKNAGMFQFLLDLYYEASIDNAADKQFKNLVVYNLARVPDYWDKAVGILGNMTEKPDLFMYTSGILACETGGDWEHAIYLVDKLKKDGYNITTMALTSAISACAVRGRADEAKQLLDDMSAKHRLTPKLCAYNNVLLACAKAGKWQDAYAVYKRICRSSEAYNNLLKCSGELRTDEEMETWTSGGAQSNIFTYHTLIEALGAGEQPLLIDEVYRHAILHGVFRPFETISEGELDLRDHSPHMAAAAVRLLLELLLMTPGKVDNIGSPKVLADNDMDPVATLLSALSEQLNTFRSAAGLQSKILVANGLDLVLITGKGSKLRDTIKALLLKSFRPSMHAYLQKTCPDRIIIPKNSLVEWLKVRGL